MKIPLSSGAPCLLCRARLSLCLERAALTNQWLQTRSVGQLQKKRPSRMALSPRVAQKVPHVATKERQTKKRMNSPFDGMNRTRPGIRGMPRREHVPASNAARNGFDGVRALRKGDAQDLIARPINGRSRDFMAKDKDLPQATRPDRAEKSRKPQKERETFHALKMQSALSPISYVQRSILKAKMQVVDSFDKFEVLPSIQEAIAEQALSGLEELQPTPVQRLAIPMLLGNDLRPPSKRVSTTPEGDMEQYLLAAETGSGKTLAYLIPVLNAIKQADIVENEGRDREVEKANGAGNDQNFHFVEPPIPNNTPHHTTGRPRAIILVPTSELVTQVGNVVKTMSHKIKFRSAMISAAYSPKVIRNRLFSPSGIDVLITTPHLLASITESDPNILSRVTHLVVDEADSLLDRSFAPSTSTIVDRATPSLRQLILCSATIPRSLDSYLRRRFPDMHRIVTPNLHAIPRRVQLGVIDIEKQPYLGNKMLACADSIWTIGKAAAEQRTDGPEATDLMRILVFVNEREKSVEVAEYLDSKGIDAVALNRDAPVQRQAEALNDFTIPTRRNGHNGQENAEDDAGDVERVTKPAVAHPRHSSSTLPRAKRRLPMTKVLVATDLGSRGIDTIAVRHVILYDVPHSTIDFIHRLGRTGRMGRRGRGIVLVGKHDRKDVVREVREGMFKGQALI